MKSSPSSEGISTVVGPSGGSDWRRLKRMNTPTASATSRPMMVTTYDDCDRGSEGAAT